MNGPRETLEVEIDPETTARIEIQIVTAPFPAPHERETLSIPTARQIDATARLLHARKHTFPHTP